MSDKRIICVGDIHGCLDEYEGLLRLVSYSPNDRLVLLGDLVDRGPDSIGVVRKSREINAESVRGNHCDWYVRMRLRTEQLRRGEIKKIEMRSTPQKLAIFDALSEDDWAYIDRMPWWIFLDRKTVAVHAGFEPNRALIAQRPDKVCRIVYIDPATGKCISGDEDHRQKPPGSVRWATMFKEYSVVYGHAVFSFESPTIDVVGDMSHAGLDTGCYAGGHLTALVITPDGKREIAQVKARQCYLPRELSEL